MGSNPKQREADYLKALVEFLDHPDPGVFPDVATLFGSDEEKANERWQRLHRLIRQTLWVLWVCCGCCGCCECQGCMYCALVLILLLCCVEVLPRIFVLLLFYVLCSAV